ncbi:MAG: hypothetical protein K9W42_01865 [Candidatus Heimdallarchaeota archaeon]|nr:hypothetical protein [Candidatus Heimdallarchaeota archaeon]
MANGPVLTWRCDPLLYDPQAVSADAWLTANKLIEQGQLERIFYDQAALKLELYPILVRKVDFLRERQSDRILARFPFKVLTEDEIAAINDRLLSLAEHVHHYFYRSIDFSIRSWREKLRHYLKRGALPFPLLRCFWALEPELPCYPKDYVAFESARGKRYKLPCKVTKQLAYLCGIVNGDGHLRTHWLRIIDESKEHILFVSQLFEQTFEDGGVLFPSENAWNVEVRSSAVIRLINFLTDQTINGAKYNSLREPLLFQLLGQPYRALYWRGAMDADGSYLKQILFTSVAKKYIEDFRRFLKEENLPAKIHTTKLNAFMLTLPAKYTHSFATLVGVSHPQKQKAIYHLLSRKRYSSRFTGLKPGVLTSEGYFNFLLFSGLEVVGVESLLEEFRANRSYYAMRDLFAIPQGSYSKYEKSRHAIPLTLIHEVVKRHYQSTKSLMAVLADYEKNLRFKTTSSAATMLPLRPSPELLHLASFLDPRESYINILVDYRTIVKPFYNQFKIMLDSARLFNRLLAHFFQTFFAYDLTNVKMIQTEFLKLKQSWDDSLRG